MVAQEVLVLEGEAEEEVAEAEVVGLRVVQVMVEVLELEVV